MEIQNFHFEVLHFSTSILGFLHFSQDFYAGFYKVVEPTDLPFGELWTNGNKRPIGELYDGPIKIQGTHFYLTLPVQPIKIIWIENE
jgi:hypothetical protein